MTGFNLWTKAADRVWKPVSERISGDADDGLRFCVEQHVWDPLWDRVMMSVARVSVQARVKRAT